MDTFVITIARGFGSGGKQIGLLLSKRLGIPCYDSQILSMASECSGLNENLFTQVDERLRGPNLLRHLRRAPDTSGIIAPTEKRFVSDDNLFCIQAWIIGELAKTRSCVVIGKCANFVLRHRRNVVSAYVEAPRAACVTGVVEKLGVTEAEAHRMIERTDGYRSAYYRYYTGGEDWTNPTLYDLTLNSDRLGYANCARVIEETLKCKLGEDILTQQAETGEPAD